MLSVEEAFGTESASRSHNEAVKELGEIRRRNRDTLKNQSTTSAIQKERRLRLSTGGLMAQSMRGFAQAEKGAVRLADPALRSPREGTEAYEAGNEVIDRIVESVYRALGSVDYKDITKLEIDTVRILDKVDRMIE
jgi:hypothetical protein